ncbi:hypothetical protein N0V93_009233 [Gnomoniopsis smithogilvyi]|uniref:C2H2-type domain-containing protein n=1 Tax=Gnomoniopsis smithogilvyi TaxID=1191159 RepID=A0A9W9CTG6_9PEZI|nr:hypothetical protein N0V93_009233 [Gnomoniopsis smithogilvyi]
MHSIKQSQGLQGLPSSLPKDKESHKGSSSSLSTGKKSPAYISQISNDGSYVAEDDEISSNPSHDAPSSSSQAAFDSSLPYFRLTNQELKDLQRRKRQTSTYVFGDPILLRELEDLGRGWGAFVRAQEQARQDGVYASFKSKLKAEMDETARLGVAYSKGTGAKLKLDDHDRPLPPGAVSLLAAKQASKQITGEIKKRKRSESAKLEQLALQRRNGDVSSDEDFEPPYVSKGRGRHRGPKSKNSTMPADPCDKTPRPKRKLTKPDYTTTKIHEATDSDPVPSKKSKCTSSPTPREIYKSLEPHFTEFPCHWKGCKAVLMNLSTLKKHLSTVHSNEAREQLRCKWDKCSKLKTPVFFCKLSDVDSHVLECHIQEVAWRLGDGVGGVIGGPVVLDYSVDPPLRLFRNGGLAKAAKETEGIQ